jgi:signal transduction histidine kinase
MELPTVRRSTIRISFKQIRQWLVVLWLVPWSNGKAQDSPLADSISCLISPQNPQEFISGIDLPGLRFIKAKNNRINLGFPSDQTAYVILKLSTTSDPALKYLTIDNTSLDTILIFNIRQDGSYSLLYNGGALVAMNGDSNPIWHEVPVRISGKPAYLLLAMKAGAKNVNISYYLLDKADLDRRNRSLDRLVFFYLGAVALIIIFILLTYFLFRNSSLAAYFGYIVCFSSWIVCHYGYLFPLLYPHHPIFNEIAKPIFSLGACFFLLMVFRILFRERIMARIWLNDSLRAISFLLPLVAVSMLWLLVPSIGVRAKAALIAGWQLATIIAFPFIIITPLCFFYSGTTAKIFSLAALVTCIMAIVQLFSNYGFINNYFINEHGMTTASLIEIFIMAFGLFYNLLKEKQDKEMQVLHLELENSETLKRLIAVQDNERKRIAGDLHDNIGPLLSALKMNFRRIVHSKQSDPLNELSAKTEIIIDDSIAEIRNIAHNLMPKGLSAKGLINTLSDYFESIRQLYHKEIDFIHDVQFVFPPDLQINLYRIICELVLNAAKHSHAHLITICIRTDETLISLTVQDDGKGFSVRPGGLIKTLGLQNVEGRLWYLKGKLNLETFPGRGTAIFIEIPTGKGRIG